MMERDRRLTGSLRGQSVNIVELFGILSKNSNTYREQFFHE